jgi:hypothetical protein
MDFGWSAVVHTDNSNTQQSLRIEGQVYALGILQSEPSPEKNREFADYIVPKITVANGRT